MPNKIPSNYFCPITCKVMLNPYQADCSHNFEKSALIGWLQINPDFCCPNCSGSLQHSQIQNDFLRASIQRFFIANPEAIGLVQSSIESDTRKQNILRQIKSSQSVLPSINLDEKIIEEWNKVLSSCIESNTSLINKDSYNYSTGVPNYISCVEAGYFPSSFTQMSAVAINNPSMYSLALTEIEPNAEIEPSLQEARRWYINSNNLENFDRQPIRHVGHKSRSCTIT